VTKFGEQAMVDALRRRYPSNEWALLAGVRNATGFASREVRTADAVALNLWPSKGMPLLGFECKSDRRDWQRELAQPEKSWAISRFCDQWWVVAGGEDVVRKDELPKTWGLLVMKPEGTLKCARMAPQLEDVQPMSRGFMVSLFRAFVDQATGQDDVERRARALADEFWKAERPQLERQISTEAERNKRRAESALAQVDAWRAALGPVFREQEWIYPPEAVGRAVARLMAEQRAESGIKAKARRLMEMTASLTDDVRKMAQLVEENDDDIRLCGSDGRDQAAPEVRGPAHQDQLLPAPGGPGV